MDGLWMATGKGTQPTPMEPEALGTAPGTWDGTTRETCTAPAQATTGARVGTAGPGGGPRYPDLTPPREEISSLYAEPLLF